MQAAILIMLWLWAALLIAVWIVLPVVVLRWIMGGRKNGKKDKR